MTCALPPAQAFAGSEEKYHVDGSVQGLDDEILSVLNQRFPADTLRDLEGLSHNSLTDMAEAFPDDTILPSTNFHSFCRVKSCPASLRRS